MGRMVKGSKFRAAIASQDASKIQGVNNIAYPINDVPGNCTRFVLLKRKKAMKIVNIICT